MTLAATADGSSTFAGWSGACTGTSTCTVTMDAAKNVTATFTRRTYILTVTRTGSGTITSTPLGIYCGAACSATYDAGATVTLTATPDADATFAGWSGACVRAPARAPSRWTRAKTVVATFVVNTYGLSVTKTGTGSRKRDQHAGGHRLRLNLFSFLRLGDGGHTLRRAGVRQHLHRLVRRVFGRRRLHHHDECSQERHRDLHEEQLRAGRQQDRHGRGYGGQ